MSKKILSKEYTNKFYIKDGITKTVSIKKVVPIILEFFPKSKNLSVIDFGCSTGSWLKAFQEKGCKICGVDGNNFNPNLLHISKSKFHIHDLEKVYSTNEKFDFAICFEVAEHISEKSSMNLLHSLTNAADIIFFSAAIPFQDGVHHVNMQWPTYWIKKFNDLGYTELDCIRKKIWNEKDINVIYRQNIFMFVKNDNRYKDLLDLRKQNIPSQYDLVHPDLWNIYRKKQNRFRKIIGYSFLEKIYNQIKILKK